MVKLLFSIGAYILGFLLWLLFVITIIKAALIIIFE